MKVSLTFHELELEEAADIFNIATPGSKATIGAPILDPVEPKKRKRRTKAEMEAARNVEAVAAVENNLNRHLAEETPAPRRRHRRKRKTESAVDEAAEGNLKRGRRRREGAVDPTPEPRRQRESIKRSPETDTRSSEKTSSTTKSPSDNDISDADVAKKASEAAQELTPRPVIEKLEEFGVAVVNDLDQEQRHEFFDWVDAELDELPEQAEKTVEKPKRRRRKK